MRNRTIALAATLLVTAAAVPAFGHPPDSPGRPGVPDESGCRDIIGGSQGYQQLIESIEQNEYFAGSGEGLGDAGMYKHREVTVRNKGVATAGLVLAAPSCADVQYTIEVYNLQGTLLASHTQFGDGDSGVNKPLLVEAVVAKHDSASIKLRAFTKSGDVVHDVAPDKELDPAGATAAEDGYPSSGATTSFK